MRKWICLIILVLSIGWIALDHGNVLVAQESSSQAKPSDVQMLKGRAISLKILQERHKSCQGRNGCPEKLLQMAGINQVLGFVVDEANDDLILIGRIEENSPPIHLEDFVIALKNAWYHYAELRGNTRYYSYPGCTIDPDPEVMGDLQDIGIKINESPTFKEVEKKIKSWHEICGSPQKVDVMGIPFDSRFAEVMVKADYDMKSLADGSDSLHIEGFISHTDMYLQEVKKDIAKEQPVSMNLSMDRFWFYPGKNFYKSDDGVVIIEQCPVILLTEEEHLSRSGEIVGKNRPSPLAEKFTEDFSTLYNEVANQRPIYAELEDLFRFVALAKILFFMTDSLGVDIGADLEYLLNQFPIAVSPVDRKLPGRSRVRRFEERKDFSGGYQIYKLWLPSCGGVTIEIKISKDNFVEVKTGDRGLAAIKAEVIKARPSPDALFWDYKHWIQIRIKGKDINSDRYVFSRPEDNYYSEL
jgi:hypothetical protein